MAKAGRAEGWPCWANGTDFAMFLLERLSSIRAILDYSQKITGQVERFEQAAQAAHGVRYQLLMPV